MQSQRFLLWTAFLSGMCIMAMELSAARLIAPHFGTSLFVWTNVIGVVLVALSIGYYLGGRLADRRPDLTVLLSIIAIAGGIFVAVPWLVAPFASLIKAALFSYGSASMLILVGSFLSILLLFALPLLLLGMVSPFVIKLSAHSVDALGEQTGKLFAVSTLGSILGTFLPTLVFIPWVGTRATILLFAAVLLCLAGTGLWRERAFQGGVVALVLFAVLGSQVTPVHAGQLVATESSYQHIAVIEEEGWRYLVFNEGLGVQSLWRPGTYFYDFYYDVYALLPALFDRPQVDVGIIGLAGGTISRTMSHVYGDGVRMDGVEIDQKVIRIAREYFELDQPQLTVFHEDGRTFLERQDDAYDVLIVDAYAQQLYVQWTMTTQEFWEDADRALHEGGLVALNVNATSPTSPLLQSITNTIASVFPYTYVIPLTDNGSYNYMVVASRSEIPFDRMAERFEADTPLGQLAPRLLPLVERVELDPDGVILTDDRAPVELMTEAMILEEIL